MITKRFSEIQAQNKLKENKGNNEKKRSNIVTEIGNTKLQQFSYLESTITENNCCGAEIETRIVLGKENFQKMKNALINKHVSTEARKAF